MNMFNMGLFEDIIVFFDRNTCKDTRTNFMVIGFLCKWNRDHTHPWNTEMTAYINNTHHRSFIIGYFFLASIFDVSAPLWLFSNDSEDIYVSNEHVLDASLHTCII